QRLPDVPHRHPRHRAGAGHPVISMTDLGSLISSALPAPWPGLLLAVLQVLFVLAFSPLMIGIMRKVKARFQGRSGSPLTQPYVDLAKLLAKGTTRSSTTSFVFAIAPMVGLSAAAIAALLMPILSPLPLLAANIIIFVYLFAIGRFLTALSGLDAGSAFGGMGSSREMMYSIFIEPALFAIVLFLAASGTLAIAPLAPDTASWLSQAALPGYWLAAIALFVAILAETGRLPFDNPATHLELTMVHEAMILENSGHDLALIEWANAAKIFLFFCLAAVLLLPGSLQASAFWPLYLLLFCAGLSVLTAAVESISVKVRLFKVPELLILSALLALLAFLMRLTGAAALGDSLLNIALATVMLLSSLYFIFSATFRRRLELYVVQSICLAVILVASLAEGTPDAYYLLAVTIAFKVVLIPLAFYQLFRGMSGEVKIMPLQFYLKFSSIREGFKLDLNFDPLFMSSPMSTSRALIYAGILITIAFVVAPALGSGSLLLPLVISIILLGMLIIASKTHLLLQLLGFLMMENGVVLLPYALHIQMPLIGEAVVLFDVVILVAIALLLSFKMRGTHGTLDTQKLAELTEKR
ncbi:MAG: NADH-quinone oxidoreductase subunit H, partial [Candidatus Micrarchaeota archaeon]|nr:NADH-quinone oxidoreductase subunit H [Candidatus Micrarchaeota archaeon]